MEKKASRRTARKLTCRREDGIYLGVKATAAEVIVGNRNGVWLTRIVWRKPAKERWDRSNLEMVPWHKNEETSMCRFRRVCISRENLEEFGFTARCPGCMSLLRGTARQSKANRGEAEGHSEGTCVIRRMKEYLDRAAEKGTKQTKSGQEE